MMFDGNNNNVKFEEIRSLNELDCLWKKAHAEEAKNKSFVDQYISESSYATDGVIDNIKWEESKYRILYIMKEPNGKSAIEISKSTRHPVNVQEFFWFKNIVFNNHNRLQEISEQESGFIIDGDKVPFNKEQTGGIIFNRLTEIQKRLTLNSETLESSAYINLKKRCGDSKSTPKTIKAYYDDYQSYVLKQIELIQPQRIVFCGTYHFMKKEIDFINKSNGDKMILWVSYHPSYPCSNEKFYKRLEKI